MTDKTDLEDVYEKWKTYTQDKKFKFTENEKCTNQPSHAPEPEYTKEKFLKKFFGGLNMEEIQECLKHDYPENFV